MGVKEGRQVQTSIKGCGFPYGVVVDGSDAPRAKENML